MTESFTALKQMEIYKINSLLRTPGLHEYKSAT